MSFIKKNIKKIGISVLSLAILLTSIKMDFIAEANTGSQGVQLTTDDTFETNGGTYTAEHIFRNYNVFSFGDVTSMHINGAIISQADLFSVSSIDINNLTYNKGVGGVAFSDTLGDFKTLNSSYIKGQVEMKYSINQPIDFYVGFANDLKYENWRYILNGKSANTNASAIYQTDSYVDWNRAYSDLKAESKKMAEVAENIITSADIKQREHESYVLIKPGQQVLIPEELHDNIDYLMFESSTIFDTDLTIISYMKEGKVRELPIKYGPSEAGQHHNNIETGWHPGSSFGSDVNAKGINIINNYPNAKTIVNNGNSGAAFSTGQILALDATIFNTAGNINGNQIVKNIYTTSEIHMWPLSVPITLPKTVDINVNKTWLGKVGEPVTVELLADGNVQEEVILSDENQWNYNFTNLKEKNKNGQIINYTINEVELDKYQGEIKKIDANNFEIINKNYGKTSLTVTKEWIGAVGEAVKIDLLADDVRKETIELNEINNWTHTFEDLPEYGDTSKIQYTVSEHDGEKYAVEYKEVTNGFKIINDNRGFTDIEIQKTWLGLKGKEVNINLLADSKIIDSAVLNDANGWQTVFSKLPKLTSDGKMINYEVKELDANQYNPQIVKNGNKFEIINTNLVSKDIEISKEWIGKEAGAVQVELLANGVVLKTIELSQQNDWKHLFTDLFTYDVNGNEIEYSVNEIDGQLYNVDIVETDTGFKLTNTNHGNTHVDVKKTWKGEVGDPVEIELLNNNIVLGKVVLGIGNKWSHRFENLPLYDDLGNKLIYSVKEVNGDQYDAIVKELRSNDFEIINTNLGTKDINVKKKWIGHVDGPVTIKLFKNGNGLKDVELNSENDWKHTFTNLEKYNYDGTENVYTIDELDSQNYENVEISKVNDDFIVTNTNLKETSVNVEKQWIGQKESQVEIELYKNSEKIETIQLNDKNNWNHEFTKLEMYNPDGSEAIYEIKEVNGHLYDVKIEENSKNDFTVKNTNLGQTSVKVNKTWIGKPIDEIEINLLANGIKKDSRMLNNLNDWSTSFENLKKYDNNGNKIEYTISETNGDRFNAKIIEIEENSFELVNTNKGKTEVVVNKNWIGKKEEVTINLLADGIIRDNVKLNDKNNWTHTFDQLHKYNDEGKEISYYVEEVNGDLYDVQISRNGNEFNILNSNKGHTEVSVNKTWIGKQEENVNIKLKANGVQIDNILLNQENEWKHVFKKLEKYDNDGNEINYTVEEVDGEKYDVQIKEPKQNSFELINTNLGLKTITVDKTWIGKPESFAAVKLIANDKVIDEVTLNDENNWHHVFKDLNIYDSMGAEIIYTLEEVNGEHYDAQIVEKNPDQYEIKNTNKGITFVEVSKKWIGIKEENVIVNLLADEKIIDSISLSESNNWKHKFENLSIYDNNGNKIRYSVEEKDGDQYSVIITETEPQVFEIVNENLGHTSIRVDKEWIGKQEDFVEIKLFKNGNGIKDVVLNKENGWSNVFEDLEKYNPDGTLAVYTVEELNSDKFTVDITKQSEGFKITNTNLGTTAVEVTKEWIGQAEESVEVELLVGTKVVDKVVLSDTNQWHHVFEDLNKYNVDGKEIEYSVNEVGGNRFNAVIDEFEPNKFSIINTNLGKTRVDVNKKWIGKPLEEVQIELYADNQFVEKIILNETNQWEYSFENLDRYNHEGQEIKYTVDEVNGHHYDYTIEEKSSQSFEITNKNLGQTQIDVKKIWIGKAEDVEVNLLADDKIIDKMILSEKNQWQHSFINLEKYDTNGLEIGYSIEEVNGDKYNSVIEEVQQNSFEITNTNLGSVEVKVDKVWNGKVEKSIEIELYANNDLVDTVTLSTENNWTHTFKHLEQYTSAGVEIDYTVKEVNGELFDAKINEINKNHFKIENTNLKTTDVSVAKTWIGQALDEININLLKDGKEIETIALSPENNWNYTFLDLPKYNQDGSEIVYTVEEINGEVFDAKIKEINKNSFEIINTNLGTTTREVHKNWIGHISGPIVVELYKNDIKVKEVILSKENSWKYVFDNLELFNKDGSLTKYEIKEVLNDSYDVETEVRNNTTIITNKNLGETEVKVSKLWLGKKENSVSVNLLANEKVVDTVELSSNNFWNHTFKQLDKYDKNGQEIKYLVDEVDGEKFEYEIVELDKNKFEIINTNQGETSVKVEKTWIGKTEDQAQINLLANNKEIDKVDLSSKNNWKHEFINLRNYDLEGNEINYTINETDGETFNVEITEISEKNYKVTNYNLQETEVSVRKQWIGKPEESVRVSLFADDIWIDSIELNKSMNWKYTFSELNRYDESGKEIVYTILEENQDKYEGVISEESKNSFVITNTNLGETTVNVKKTWVGKAENEVEINLLANGIIKESIVLNNENSWKYTFEGLEQYDSNGKEISYRVEEVGGDKYNAEIKELDKNNYEITNYNQGSRSIKIDKIWDGKALDSVEIDLVADGKWLDTFTLNDDNHWSLEVNNLPIYDEDGNFIKYNIVEKYYENYTSTLSGDVENGFVITNKGIIPVDPVKPETEDPKEVSPGSKDPDTPNDEGVLGAGREPKLPSTGMGISANIYLGGLLTIIGLVIKRKNKH